MSEHSQHHEMDWLVRYEPCDLRNTENRREMISQRQVRVWCSSKSREMLIGDKNNRCPLWNVTKHFSHGKSWSPAQGHLSSCPWEFHHCYDWSSPCITLSDYFCIVLLNAIVTRNIYPPSTLSVHSIGPIASTKLVPKVLSCLQDNRMGQVLGVAASTSGT